MATTGGSVHTRPLACLSVPLEQDASSRVSVVLVMDVIKTLANLHPCKIQSDPDMPLFHQASIENTFN